MDTKTELVGKLLALAEQASTAEEAATAYAKAQKIASDYAIDLAVAKATATNKTIRETPVARTVNIGAKGKHANKPLVSLFDTIARVNDVSVLIYNASTRIIATGFPSDLDTVESMWMSASITMTRLGDERISDKNAAWRTETVRDYDYYGIVEKPVGAKGARRSFYDSFISGFGTELKKIRAAAIQESDERHFHQNRTAVAELSAAPTGTALVLKEKKAEVQAAQQHWYEEKHGKNRKPGVWDGSSNARRSLSMAADGYAAGRKAATDITSPARPAIGGGS